MEFLECDLDQKSWDAAVSKAGGGIQQSWRYGLASGCDVQRLEAVERGKRVGLAQVLSRGVWPGFQFRMIDRGSVWLNDPPATDCMLGWDASSPLIQSPQGQEVSDRGLRLMSPATIAILDISCETRDLRAGLHQKWRNRLAAAKRSGLIVEESRDLDWIVARENENGKTMRYRGWPEDFLRGFCAAPNAWRLFVARDKNEPVAGALFLIYGKFGAYQIGWAGNKGRQLNAQNLVLWSAFQRLKTFGIAGVDLGIIDTHRAPGLARFKLGTGARPHRLGTTRLILGPPKSRLVQLPAFLSPASVK